MNEFINAFGSITVERLLVYIFAIFFIIKYARIGYQKITDFHDKEQEKESLRSLVKENSKQIKELRLMVVEHMENDRKYKLRSLSDKLFVCYNVARSQGFITPRQLENFLENFKVYKSLGGNGLAELVYKPYILSLSVIDVDSNTITEFVKNSHADNVSETIEKMMTAQEEQEGR